MFQSGAHRLRISSLDKLRRALAPPRDFGIKLVHLPLGAPEEYREKLTRPAHPSGTMQHKVGRDRSDAYRALMQRVVDGAMPSRDEAVFLAAYYRLNAVQGEVPLAAEDIVESPLFTQITPPAEVEAMLARIQACPLTQLTTRPCRPMRSNAVRSRANTNCAPKTCAI